VKTSKNGNNKKSLTIKIVSSIKEDDMANGQPKKPYTLEPDEKVTPVMVYSMNEMSWGEVVTKEIIRVGAWLRTDMAPTFVRLYLAQTYSLSSDGPDRPLPFKEVFIPLTNVISFHVMPSVKEPLYYDPNEPNRKMEPVTVFVGLFQFKGHMRMATQSTVNQFLDVTRETFIPLYEVEITHPKMPPPGIIRVPYTVVRQEVALFASTG
jgi:hypothetical protein